MTETRPVGVGRVGAGSFLLLLVDCAAWVIRPAGEERAYKDNAKVACWLPTEPKKPFPPCERACRPGETSPALACRATKRATAWEPRLALCRGSKPEPPLRFGLGAVARDWSKSRSCIVRVGPGLTFQQQSPSIYRPARW